MEKSRIFIASSGRTLTLAEMLRDELQTSFSEATLWTEESRGQPGATIIEMLRSAARSFDFAVVILAKDDLVTKKGEDAEKAKARDNCVFEAGLFVAALGLDRCFLVNGVEHTDLPSDLGGVISLPFKEPPQLSNREECTKAIRSVGFSVKDRVQKLGPLPSRKSVSLLSASDVFSKEQSEERGGAVQVSDLVVVCDLQPMSDPDLVALLRRNLKDGINYLYFLRGDEDTVQKVCQRLQELLVEVDSATEGKDSFTARLNAIAQDPTRILDQLERLCQMGSLQVVLLPSEPQFRFRLHNANDVEKARLYMKYGAAGFVLWAEGASARAVGDECRRWLPDERADRIFLSLKGFKLPEAAEVALNGALNRGFRRYFPGIEDRVRKLCFGIA